MTATRAGGSIDEERTVNAYREQYAFLVLRTVQAPLNRYERAHSDQIESESALVQPSLEPGMNESIIAQIAVRGVYAIDFIGLAAT